MQIVTWAVGIILSALTLALLLMIALGVIDGLRLRGFDPTATIAGWIGPSTPATNGEV